MSLKKVISKKIKDILRPIYYFLFKSKDFRNKINEYKNRKWDVEFEQLNKEEKKSIIEGYIASGHGSKSKTVVLFGMPKSASLYLTQLLASSLDLENFQIGFNKRSGHIYYPRLLAASQSYKPTISHCHNPPTPETEEMIRKLEILPIVTYRNLLDVIVSRRDMLIKNKFANQILSKQAIDKFMNADSDYQIKLIINLYADVYINFYVGWRDYSVNNKVLFLKYSDMLQDEIKLVKEAADYLNISITDEKINQIRNDIKSVGGINYNKGMQGRGKEQLNEAHINILREKALFFRCYDESFLGFSINNKYE